MGLMPVQVPCSHVMGKLNYSTLSMTARGRILRDPVGPADEHQKLEVVLQLVEVPLQQGLWFVEN